MIIRYFTLHPFYSHFNDIKFAMCHDSYITKLFKNMSNVTLTLFLCQREQIVEICCFLLRRFLYIFLLKPMGVLAPSLHILDGFACPTNKMSKICLAHMSVKPPSNISPTLRSHTQSFRTIGQLLKIPHFVQPYIEIFWVVESLYYF